MKPRYDPALSSDAAHMHDYGIEQAWYPQPAPTPTATSTATATATSTATATATSTATATATASGPMLVQQKTGTGTDKNFPVSFDSPPTVNNTIVICVTYTDNDTMASIDTPGTTFVQQVSSVGTGVITEIWSGAAHDSQQEVTLHTGGSNVTMSVNISEWSNTVATAQNVNSAQGLVSATVTTGSVTPIATNNVIIAAGGWTLDDYSSGPTNSFTGMEVPAGDTGAYLRAAYIIQTSATAKSTGWSLTAGINWAAAIAAFGAP